MKADVAGEVIEWLLDGDPAIRWRVLRELAEISSRLVVMSQRGREFLLDVYGVPAAKIDVIAHGLPASPGAAAGQVVFDPDEADELHKDGKKVILRADCW